MKPTQTLRLFPDSRPISLTEYGAELGIADIDAALHDVRNLWSDHRVIAMLPDWRVHAEAGAEHAAAIIESRMAELLRDLGNSALDSWQGVRHALQTAHWHSVEPKHCDLTGIAAGRPVICVASGPTAKDYLHQIKLAQTRGAVIVCADSIFRGLVEYGITPDFVTVLERCPEVARYVPSTLSPRTVLVCPPVVHPSVPVGWDGRRVWWWQGTAGIYEWFGPAIPRSPTGRSAGTMAAALSLSLGGTVVYLAGHDLVQIDGNTHAATADPYASVAHRNAEADPGDTLHKPLPTRCRDGRDRPSTQFWRGCAIDLRAMAQEHPGAMVAVDGRGVDLGIPVVDEIWIESGMPVTLPPIRRASVTRKRAKTLEHLREDLDRFLRQVDALHGTPADMIAQLLPRAWASKETELMLCGVLSVVYNAATLRGFLSQGGPKPLDRALWVLIRGIPATLRRMIADMEADRAHH